MVRSLSRLFSVFILLGVVRSYQVEYGLGHQCGQVEVAWSSPLDNPLMVQPVFPLYLNILPFNSSAIIQKIPSWNASIVSGSAMFQLSLPVGTKYVMGITDQSGNGVGTASTVRTVLPSNNSSCLVQSLSMMAQPNIAAAYHVLTGRYGTNRVSLKVNWSSTVQTPILRVFLPKMSPMNAGILGGNTLAISLPCGGIDSDQSTAVILFGDGQSFRSTPVSLVSDNCLEVTTMPGVDGVFGVYPKAAGRAIGITFAFIVLVMIIVFLVTRCQRRRHSSVNLEPGIITGEGIPRSPPRPEVPQPEMVENPPVDLIRPTSIVWQMPVYTTHRPGVTIIRQAPPRSPPSTHIETPAAEETLKEPPRPLEEPRPSITTSTSSVPPSSPRDLTSGTRHLSVMPRSRKESGDSAQKKVRHRTAPPLSFKFSNSVRRPSQSSVAASTIRSFATPDATVESPDRVFPPEGEPVPDSPTVPEFLRLPSLRFSFPAGRRGSKTKSQRSIERSTYLELLEEWDGKGFRLKNASGSLSPANSTKRSASRASSKKSRSSKKMSVAGMSSTQGEAPAIPVTSHTGEQSNSQSTSDAALSSTPPEALEAAQDTQSVVSPTLELPIST